MALFLKHQSIEQFVTRLREAYRNSSGERTIHLGDFIVSKVQAGDLTDSNLRAAFGMTVAQWNAAKTRMNARVTARNQINSAVGE